MRIHRHDSLPVCSLVYIIKLKLISYRITLTIITYFITVILKEPLKNTSVK